METGTLISPLNHFLVLFCIRILWPFPSGTSFLDNCRCFYNSFVLCYWLSGLVYGKHWSGYNLENLQISRWVIICTRQHSTHYSECQKRVVVKVQVVMVDALCLFLTKLVGQGVFLGSRFEVMDACASKSFLCQFLDLRTWGKLSTLLS